MKCSRRTSGRRPSKACNLELGIRNLECACTHSEFLIHNSKLRMSPCIRPRPSHCAPLGRLCVRGRAPAAARRARSARGDGRLDRHLPRREAAHAGGHVRLSHRQRRGGGGGRQPPAPRPQSRSRRAARTGRAVHDGQAQPRILPVVRGTRATERLSCPGHPGRRQGPRHPAVRGARVAAAEHDPSARQHARARRMGQPARRSGAPGRFPDRRPI